MRQMTVALLLLALGVAAQGTPGDDAVRVIEAAFRDGGEEERIEAIRANGRVADDRVVRLLAAGSRDPARAVRREDGKDKLVQLQITPPKAVGARTRLRFRYHLTGASAMQVQIFDLTDMDNRHVRLRDLAQGEWTFVHVDFTRDGKRNYGSDTPFAAGHQVDDIFFFVDPGAELLIDEVVLYDGGEG